MKLQAVVAIVISVNYREHPTSVLLVSTAGKPSRSLLNFGRSMLAVRSATPQDSAKAMTVISFRQNWFRPLAVCRSLGRIVMA